MNENLTRGVEAFDCGRLADAAELFSIAMHEAPESEAGIYLGNSLVLQFLPGCRDRENFAFIEKAVAVFTEISQHHSVQSVRENAVRQLEACRYLRDNSPKPIIQNPA